MKIFFFLLCFPIILLAQNTTTLTGVVKNTNNKPIQGATIICGSKGTTTDKMGKYILKVPFQKKIIVTVRHVAYQTISKKLNLSKNFEINFSPTLDTKNETLNEVIVKNNKEAVNGFIKIDHQKVKNITSTNSGIETVLLTLPGVSNNNELSSQYNVRGGNYDENLVYVNGIEVYRPFLIRSGQQEGLSFVNSQMTKKIHFSAGGFQSKYGDKLASVLDITYRKPTKLQTQVSLSLLGGSATFENVFLNNKLKAIVGLRYRNNSLLVQSKQTKINYSPNFTDIQSYISYDISKRLKLNFLGNFSLNAYNYQPLTRKTRFGTVANPIELVVYYSGQEKDRYKTVFGAISLDYILNEDIILKTTLSSFNTQEEEYFDIMAQYKLGEVNTNVGADDYGQVKYYKGIGSQINHARNDLDALITNIKVELKSNNTDLKWHAGVKVQQENIKDRLQEWEVIDSLGFSIRPKGHLSHDEPYNSYETPIVPYQSIHNSNEVTINRLMAFGQIRKKFDWNNHQIWTNMGIRTHFWKLTSQNKQTNQDFTLSPRVQVSIKPDWKEEHLFRFAVGWYSQPPFYKEFRNYQGNINPNLKAQKSIHFIIGNDYNFLLWKRPFKLTSEIYYKTLSDVNTYSVDNVRIRYRADNVSTAYAYGIDVRLNGDFVPGNDSWMSFGYLKTEENINNQGYIARPTDQRLKFGILFQDYIPNIPRFKSYLNLVYNTGLLAGTPMYNNVYQYQRRLNDYKRADLGVSYVFVDTNNKSKSTLFKNIEECTIGLELFNMFDIQNSNTNTWVRDVYSKNQYAIPNYMTGRVLNFKIKFKF